MKQKKLIPIVIATIVVSYGALFLTNTKVLVWEKKWTYEDHMKAKSVRAKKAGLSFVSAPLGEKENFRDRWLCTYFTGRGLIKKEYFVKYARNFKKGSRGDRTYKDSCPNILR
jgi:hypothetical protein